ncbi:hypothetical protein BHE74_00027805 [Ensete ventricosum]|nr:hypothetical protein BHE74_00027805 [Ensete ventricosum]
MGNCIKLQKPVTWVDDDDDFWGCTEHKKKDHGEAFLAPVKEKGRGGRSTEVRIKISKKQLEELLRQDDGNGLPLREVLADLVSMHEPGRLHDQERHWKPRLQSIPEMSEPVCASLPAVVSVRSWSSRIGRNPGVRLGKSTAGVVERRSGGGSTGAYIVGVVDHPYLATWLPLWLTVLSHTSTILAVLAVGHASTGKGVGLTCVRPAGRTTAGAPILAPG